MSIKEINHNDPPQRLHRLLDTPIAGTSQIAKPLQALAKEAIEGVVLLEIASILILAFLQHLANIPLAS
ncbi:MAG: hypothetical protein PVI92_08955 [Chromatiales bacterium]|jgi:hypothetical protein